MYNECGRWKGRPLDDARLIERARRGDVDAYAALVRAHQGMALRVARAVCGSPQDAEEAVQDAFVKAHRALGRFRADRPFRPWLLTIVANEARNRRRAAGRRTAMTRRATAEAAAVDASGPSLEDGLVAREEAEAVLAALERLPERDRLVVTYRHVLGLSEHETATILGVRSGTVKSRLARALRRLRAALTDCSPTPADTPEQRRRKAEHRQGYDQGHVEPESAHG